MATEVLNFNVAPDGNNGLDGDQDYNMGITFTPAADTVCRGVEWARVPDSVVETPTGGQYIAALWTVVGETRLASVVMTPVAGSTHQQFMFASPVSLTAGVSYTVSIFTKRYVYRGVTAAVTSPSGNLTSGVQGKLTPSSNPLSYPASNFNSWYYVSPITDVVGGSTTPFTRDYTLNWRVFNAFTKDTTLNWRVFNALTRDYTLNWRVLAAFTRDTTLVWRVLNAWTRDYSLAWRVFAAFTADTAITWRVFGAFQRDYTISWDILSGTSFQRDYVLNWRVFNTFTQDYALTWRIFASFTRDYAVTWRVFNAFTRDHTLVWRVMTGWTRDYTLVWVVLSASPGGGLVVAVWSGTAEVPVVSVAVWDGTTEIPAIVSSVV